MKHSQDNIFSGTGITATTESNVIDLREVYGFSLHGVWTKNSGTVGGSYKIQVSNDGVNFIDLASYSQALSDASGEVLFNYDGAHFAYMKIVLTLTGGDVDLNSYFSTKG